MTRACVVALMFILATISTAQAHTPVDPIARAYERSVQIQLQQIQRENPGCQIVSQEAVTPDGRRYTRIGRRTASGTIDVLATVMESARTIAHPSVKPQPVGTTARHTAPAPGAVTRSVRLIPGTSVPLGHGKCRMSDGRPGTEGVVQGVRGCIAD